MAKTKRIQVVTRDCNGDDIILMRRKTTLATIFTLGLYRPWRDWKLETERKYEISEKLHKMMADANSLLREYDEECKYVISLKKEVASETRATRGISLPYPIDAAVKEIPFKAHKHRANPGEGWRMMFSTEFLNKCGLRGKSGGSNKKSTREKVGAPESRDGSLTKYVHEDFKNLSWKSSEDSEFDNHVIYKEPNKQKNKGNRKQQQQQQKQQQQNEDW